MVPEFTWSTNQSAIGRSAPVPSSTSSTTPYNVERSISPSTRAATLPSASRNTKLGIVCGGRMPWNASSVVPSGSWMLS